jgi:alkylation response protein AidB-like acyl-CoA dehydrogenase
MALVFNEEQRLLQSTAREFLQSGAPVERLRDLRDRRDELGYSADLWQKMAELGWASIILPEQYGGLEFGFLGLGAVMEESGRTLTASPLLASAVVGASAVLLGGNDLQKESILPGVAAGTLTLALALEETNHHQPAAIAMPAVAEADHFLLSGRKLFVVDGHSADKLVVAARTSGTAGETDGLSLFLVDGDTPGLTRKRTIMADSRNAANLEFDNVKVSAANLVGEPDRGWQVLEPTLDRARVALAAEMLGSAWEAFERTVEYLKERDQFGAKIGTFQGLQHRASLMFKELEMSKSVVMQALSSVDESPDQLPLLASLAKARLNDVAKLVSNEAVQMHGGIGVTDVLEIGFFLKRARVAMQLFGDAGFHKDRYASLCGY